MKKPLWTCPRCSRQFANRNQAHSCTDVTVSDCLRGKDERVVELFRAFAAAVRSFGDDIRVHPTPSRIAFIARMTFAGAILKRDHLEAGMMLPYRSDSPRFHKFFPNGTGGVHSLRLRKLTDIDNELRNWLAEAYRCGRQEPDAPRLMKAPKTATLPPLLKRSGSGRPGKVFYLHWNEKELEERLKPLRTAGHEVLGHWSTETVAKLGDFTPDVVVISLDRLPSHGRAHAGWIWESRKRRSIPIVFAGGQPDKVLVTKTQFPEAIYCKSDDVPNVIDRLLQ